MARAHLERELDALASLREPTRRRLYEYVERQPRAVSRGEAAAAVGVSRVLAAFHLDKLVRAGLLKTEYRRLSGRRGPGAGRTSKLYRRSRHQFQLSVPRRNHQLLARLLVESFASEMLPSPDGEPARRYGRSLGMRARGRIRPPADGDRLLRCVEDVLESLGFGPYRAASGDVRLRNCPFDPLSRRFTPVVCGVAQAVVTGVAEGVGAEQLRVGRDEQPDRCCVVLNPAVDSPTDEPETGCRRRRSV
jgi:predicted ArsR family transcriptional regulator